MLDTKGNYNPSLEALYIISDFKSESTGSLTCILCSPLENVEKGSFILQVIRPRSDMIWEYNIDMYVTNHGKIVEDTYKGDAAWPSDFDPVKLI